MRGIECFLRTLKFSENHARFYHAHVKKIMRFFTMRCLSHAQP
jgi:hypothetical protein